MLRDHDHNSNKCTLGSTSVTGAVTRLGCLVLKSAPEAPDKRCPKNDDRSKCICSPISKQWPNAGPSWNIKIFA